MIICLGAGIMPIVNIRDEKVAFFVTSSQSKMEFSYIIKAQIPGEYKIMPAQGYLMYYPELSGFSDVS